jgi:lysophospholipase L1-like esterase
VDGTPTLVFTTAGSEWSTSDTIQTYRVADGLTAAEHRLEVYRNAEAMFGVVRFHGFIPAAGGALVPSQHPFNRRIEIIGDSISAGYGNKGCPFSAATENGFAAYGPVAARALDAEVHVIAWSGAGLALNYDGSTAGIMPERYPYSLPADSNSLWDTSSWIPDVVVINLGTNDFSANIEQSVFVEAYEDFVHVLRSYYANALILCATNASGGALGTSIDQVITLLGDSKVKRLDLNSPNWSGCDGHPDVVADQSMGDTLAVRLQQELGW